MRHIPINHAINTDMKAMFSVHTQVNTYISESAISEIFIIFPATTESNENSIFICDCIRANKDEFIRLTSVKAHTIAIAISVIKSLYQGRINAITNEISHTDNAMSILKVSIFPIITSFLTNQRDTSRIARV